ncbi:MAG: type I-U CRISPR-associated protein Csb2, partial [Thermoplasmata archaeon]
DNVQKGGSPIDYEIVCRYVNYIGSDVITIDVPIALFEMETEDRNWQKFEPCDLRIPSGMVRNAAIQFIKENQSFNELYGADMVSRLVAGHEGSQTNDKYNGKHIAFVPLPSLNRSGNADGWIRRVLMVGYGCETEDARKLFDDLTSALHGRAIYDNKKQIGVLRRTKSEDKDNVLRLFIGKDKRYKVWRTVTPIVLTGMMRRGRSVEDLVVRALKQSGIEPEYVDSIATFRGPIVPKTFHALDYHVRGYLEKTGRFHAEIIFKKPVIGPLILGRGRYSGFGLMMAWAESPPKDLQ